MQFFPRGEDKEAEDYGEGRDEESIVDFMNKKAGTKRTVGGGLTADAGRLADFDDYAKQFMKKCVTVQLRPVVLLVLPRVVPVESARRLTRCRARCAVLAGPVTRALPC